MSATQLCPVLCNSMDYSLPGSSVHGILQAKILEWVVIPLSRGSSPTKEWNQSLLYWQADSLVLSHLENHFILCLFHRILLLPITLPLVFCTHCPQIPPYTHYPLLTTPTLTTHYTHYPHGSPATHSHCDYQGGLTHPALGLGCPW